MSDLEQQVVGAVSPNKKGSQSLIVILLLAIALLLAGVIALFLHQQKQNQQFQRMQTAIAYFDKLEQEEKALAEQERLKAEQEKMRLALEEAKAEAKREAERAEVARVETARKAAARQETYDPCKHLYQGKIVYMETCFLWSCSDSAFIVVGYSSSSGRATIKNQYDGNMQEVSCSSI